VTAPQNSSRGGGWLAGNLTTLPRSTCDACCTTAGPLAFLSVALVNIGKSLCVLFGKED